MVNAHGKRADLEDAALIGTPHIAEALQHRRRERD